MKVHAAPHRITDEEAPLDGYGRRGVVIDRDTAHTLLGSLGRDMFEHRQRGGEANMREHARLREISTAIGTALSRG